MKRKTTIILSSIAVFILLGIILIFGAAGYLFYSFSVKNDLARKQGEAFGSSTEQKECVDESLRQFGTFKEQNIFTRTEEMHISKFTEGCLTTCKITKDFCQDVPKPDSLKVRLEWGIKKCQEAGLDINGPCNEIFVLVMKECAKPKEKTVNYPN